MLSATILAEAKLRLQQADTQEALKQLIEDITRQAKRITRRISSKCPRETERNLRINRLALNNVKSMARCKMIDMIVDEDNQMFLTEDDTSPSNTDDEMEVMEHHKDK
jgi:hypothetical protein